MKSMTCRQLGGACDLEHHGDDANVVIKAQDQHLKDAVAAGDRDEAGQLLTRVAGREQRSHLRSLRHRNVLVVADDGDVEECLQDPVLGGEQSVHRRHGDVGPLTDGVHGGGPVAALEEQRGRCVDHRRARQPRPRLVATTLRPANGPACRWHNLRLALSN